MTTRATSSCGALWMLIACGDASGSGSRIPDYEMEAMQGRTIQVSINDLSDLGANRGVFEVWQKADAPLWSVRYDAEVRDPDTDLLYGVSVSYWNSGDIMSDVEVDHEHQDNEGQVQPLQLAYWVRSSMDDANDREYFLGRTGRIELETTDDGVKLSGEDIEVVPATLEPETSLLTPTDGATMELNFSIQGPIVWHCVPSSGVTEFSGGGGSSPFCKAQVSLLGGD